MREHHRYYTSKCSIYATSCSATLTSETTRLPSRGFGNEQFWRTRFPDLILFDFPVISLKDDVICCKSGWSWRVGLISELDFKEICLDFSWFQLDFNWFLHEVYEISFVANPSCTVEAIESANHVWPAITYSRKKLGLLFAAFLG